MDHMFNSVVLQPTSLCNLNCKYCYLADRDKNLKMMPVVIEKVVDAIKACGHPFRITWHGGEPMSSGLEYFESLIRPMRGLMSRGSIQQVIQTNATLINKRWCNFFLENEFRVGVSIDGPEWANKNRIKWNGAEAYSKILSGIQLLREEGVQFSAICVVTEETITRPEELYEFFCDLGCFSLGINFEEKVGLNYSTVDSDELVTEFWQRLFRVWRQDPQIEVRPFQRMLSRLEDISCKRPTIVDQMVDKVDLFPSVSYSGGVVLLSPEFLDVKSFEHGNFIVGNVLNEPLLDILERWHTIRYVTGFIKGLERCQESCQYFSVCGGGQASNKFFEHGSVNSMETCFCRNTYQHLADAIIGEL